ncbi:MAG: glycosyltransferase [Candidatus Krumholzibacteriota bacterium]|nr:glycosyltransferase [Candidatus Krumholzibacteriota bacterium]
MSAPAGIVLSNLFPNSAEPTRGQFIWQETRALARRHPLTVVSPLPWVPPGLRSRPRYAFHAARRRERREGLEVRYPRHLVPPGFGRFLYGDLMVLALAPLLRRLVREGAPRFLVAHYVYPDGYAAVRLGRRHGLPVLVKARGSDVNVHTDDALRRRLTLWTLRRADAVAAVSAALRERMAALGLERGDVAVVPNGVDTALFYPRDRDACRRELGLEAAPTTFLFVGNWVPVKGLDVLLEAFAMLGEVERAGLRLLLLGGGGEEAALREAVRVRDLDAQVRFLPAVPHDAVPLWMGACDCLVLPSRMEGCPNVLVEALACGRPVVASRVGGVPEIVVEGETGLLVPPGRPAPLADALRQAAGFALRPEASPLWGRDWEQVGDEMAGLVAGMLARSDHRQGRDPSWTS